MLTIKSSAKKAKKIGEEFKINCDGFTSCAALYAYLADNYSHLLEVCVTAVYSTVEREKWDGFKLSRLSLLKQLLTGTRVWNKKCGSKVESIQGVP